LFELDIEVRTSDFENLLFADAIVADRKTDDLETINGAADLLGTLLECDIEEQYLADVRALRDDAISLQPILWARAEELRRRAAHIFANMPSGLRFLEIAGAFHVEAPLEAMSPQDSEIDQHEEQEDLDAEVADTITDHTSILTLSGMVSGTTGAALADRLIAVRIPLTVMQKAASLMHVEGAVEAEILSKILAELSRRLDAIVVTNLSLVTWLANRYRNRGLEYLDLVQEGNIGLMKAVQKFDPSRGAQLATYAIWWIRQCITRAISDSGRTIRLPVHIQDRAKKLQRIRNSLQAELGVPPTVSDIANKLETSVDTLAKLEQAILLMPIRRDNVEPLTEKAAHGIRDTSRSPEEVMWDRRIQKDISEVLLGLPPRQERIVRMRFGIGRPYELTLEQVGATFDVTRERIRQIEAKSLRHLSHPARSSRLKGILDVQ